MALCIIRSILVLFIPIKIMFVSISSLKTVHINIVLMIYLLLAANPNNIDRVVVITKGLTSKARRDKLLFWRYHVGRNRKNRTEI